MHVCIYVCMCMCVFVCMYVCMYMYVCLYVCMYVCMHVYKHMYIHTYAHMYVRTYVHAYIHTFSLNFFEFILLLNNIIANYFVYNKSSLQNINNGLNYKSVKWRGEPSFCLNQFHTSHQYRPTKTSSRWTGASNTSNCRP